MNGTNRIGWIGCVVTIVVLAAGCAIYRNDRAWIPEEQYAIARAMYLQTGSLDLVQRQLEEMQWRRGRINETVYRLQKEFEVLPEELPPALPEAEAPAPRGAGAAAQSGTPGTTGTQEMTVPVLPPPPAPESTPAPTP